MSKTLIIKLLLLGFLSWLIPFVISFLFYKPGGELVVPYGTFKATIMVAGTISGCYLLFRYFKFIQTEFIKHAIIVGLSWFGINIFLDAIILIPMMKTSFSEYFMTIGIGYIAIPAISITMGFILNAKN
ncbi:MAG TPA: hypothetical protein PKD91_07140 [Bacteroidia bacterium]|nr:hypothetical protein [Bacteroidia bacterium]